MIGVTGVESLSLCSLTYETLVRVPEPKTSYRKRIIMGFKDGDDLPPLQPETMGMRNPDVYNLKW